MAGAVVKIIGAGVEGSKLAETKGIPISLGS